jgi:signal peptide peptidase SppA
MSRRRKTDPTPPAAGGGLIDLRAAARALLEGEHALALEPGALKRIVAIANAVEPMLAERPGPSALSARRNDTLDVRGGVAIVPLQGVLTPRPSLLSLLFGGGGSGLQAFRSDLRTALGHPDVESVVLDVHSPGGVIGLIPETAREVRALAGSKPIVAVANTMTASAAYWIASQADEVVVTPSGLVGSIGVYVMHEDWSGFNESMGVIPTYVSRGTYKVEGNFDEPLSDEARAALQREVDELYGMFAGDVAIGRGTTPDAVEAGYGEGRVLPAQAALNASLVDRIATLDETVRELSGGAGRDRARAKASDRSRTMHGEDDDNRGPNATGEVAEEVRARIAELREMPSPITL